MCGIAGIFNQKRNLSQSETALLREMADALVHRGPDEEGFYSSGPVGFAHRRLSIIDIQSGQQPMVHSESGVCLLYNGEVFNYIELRAELKLKGHRFHTDSDTEVVLQAYLAYGLEFVNRLNGQFALAIWDPRNMSLLLTRDRVGICPLFYSFQNNRLCFGSEIKAIKPALERRPTLNAGALDQIFTFWTPVGAETIYQEISTVQPGEMVLFTPEKVEHKTYWNWLYEPAAADAVSESTLSSELYELLNDATRIRLRSDVPVGTYLSGGLDSSAITALTQKISPQSLHSFSLSFEEQEYDESVFQHSVQSALNSKHHEIRVSVNDIANQLLESLQYIECPILRAAPVPMGLLSGFVAQQCLKVVLTGEGADEVFGGYDIFKETKVRAFWSKQQNSSWRPLLLKKLYPYMSLPASGGAEYLRQFFGIAIDQPDHLFFSHLPRWLATSKSKLFYSSEFAAELSSNAEDVLRKSFEFQMSGLQPFNRAQFIESKLLMPGYLLSSQGDRMLMKNSIEGRFPFLDHRVIDFASRLPNSLKMKVLNEKYILKQAVKSVLPEAIVNRYKQPFRAPDSQLLSVLAHREDVLTLLSDQNINRFNIFDSKKVNRLIAKARKTALNTAESQAFMGILSTQAIAYENF